MLSDCLLHNAEGTRFHLVAGQTSAKGSDRFHITGAGGHRGQPLGCVPRRAAAVHGPDSSPMREHAHVLRRDSGKTFERGMFVAHTMPSASSNDQSMSKNWLPAIRHRRRRWSCVDCPVNCLYELLALVVILGDANEAHGEFGERYSSPMCGEEQHEAQTAIHFASRLGTSSSYGLCVRTILVLRLVAASMAWACHHWRWTCSQSHRPAGSRWRH